MDSRPIARRSSRTAAYTCVTRAALNREASPLLHCADNLSQVFLPPFARATIAVTLLRRLFLRLLAPKGIPEYVLARTRILDDAFVRALDESFPQVVILGAGFDTRALRFHGRNRNTKVYELDIDSTQSAKLGVYQRKHVELPDELRFVSIDFDTQDLGTTLSAAGYRDGVKTLFLWEGVTMYLTAEAVHRTLDFVKRSAASGSELVFDYVRADVVRGTSRLYGDRRAAKTVSDTGEAWTFGLEQGDAESLLAARGFTMRAHYSAEDMERLFFTAEDGTVLRRVNGTHCIVVAGVR